MGIIFLQKLRQVGQSRKLRNAVEVRVLDIRLVRQVRLPLLLEPKVVPPEIPVQVQTLHRINFVDQNGRQNEAEETRTPHETANHEGPDLQIPELHVFQVEQEDVSDEDHQDSDVLENRFVDFGGFPRQL